MIQEDDTEMEEDDELEECPDCEEEFKTLEALAEHYRRSHATIAESTQSKQTNRVHENIITKYFSVFIPTSTKI